MTTTLTVKEPQALGRMLTEFLPSTAHKGENYFRQGRVVEWRVLEAERSFEANVRGGHIYQVTLSFDDAEGEWTSECSCPVVFDCKHAYAAGKALLAEQTVANVIELSAGRKAPTAPPPELPLARLLFAKLGRTLLAKESKYLRSIHRVYERCRGRGWMGAGDLQELGFWMNRDFYSIESSLWPKFPANEHLFWLFIARGAVEKGHAIPEFMEPISDLRPVEEVMAAWRREENIKMWTARFASLEGEAPVAPGNEPMEDFRISLCERAAKLQWKRPGADDFETPKPGALRDLRARAKVDRLRMPLEAELIWQIFARKFDEYSTTPTLEYGYQSDAATIARLLSRPELESRIVGENGQPLRRVHEPVRWELRSVEKERDYRLRLVQANGEPLPSLLAVLKGSVTLYVTQDAVFTGPPSTDAVLDPENETRIPAEVIETPEGIGALSKLHVLFPAQLQERIRPVQMQLEVRCELGDSYGREICLVKARGISEDHLLEAEWNSREWLCVEDRRKTGKKTDTITFYDETGIDGVQSLLAPLSLRNESDRHASLSTRITKAFPEIFGRWLESLPPNVAVHLDPELVSLTQDAMSGRVRLEVTESEIDWFDLRVVLDVSDTTLSQDELKLLLNAKGGFVRLKGKGWRRLKFDLSGDDEEQLARIGLTARELSAEPQRLHALQLAEPAAKRFLPEEQVAQIERRVSELKTRVTPEIPGIVAGQLRPYQRDGFHFLAYLAENGFGGILADDMGLGKTLQTLTWLAWLHERCRGEPAAAVPPSLVVCPKSVMDNWQAEVEKFTRGLRVRVWAADQLAKMIDEVGSADLHVINYAQLRLQAEELKPLRWLAVILDEGQYIKNPSSQTAQAARLLTAQYRLVLSGTPIENRLLDLWSLMAFAMPGVLGSRGQFARLYDGKGDPLARRRLAARVRPFLIRRTKGQVAKDLPDRVEEDLFCEMEGEQRALYRAELKRAQQMLLSIKTQNELAKQQFHFLTSLLRLRQICCHPRLLQADSPAPSAKVEALLEQIEPLMEEGHKVLVFSQFVQMLELLKPELEERDWPFFWLSGETENRGQLVNSFQTANGAAIFLISLKAGGFGLNLTAASYVVLFDPWWNPAVENQAIDRTHRIGQVNKVIAYRLLIKNSIEEKIRQLQKHKSTLVQDVFGEEKFAQSLTLDDFRYLLAD